MRVRAVAKDVGISPRKVILAVNTVRGREVSEALTILKFLPTPAARAVAKVIKSAAANAENNFQLSTGNLKIADILAEEGRTLKRFRPKSRGRVSPILKRSTRITVSVEEK
ncbi:MAG: 50S ribosomal protein L22 [Dehalococcoidia bacterium]|nr:50S ribosomal protein L22 [Chloroflexota bacterium]MCK4222317.1 50S ribosomal protein L22 [Dehalococcoidia bacterium]MCK4262916.1 50S ribosomal protein L22 [Dehalococcoidia bacterium]MCK4580742.1 50S ribosomal protein L22 [Dehalococcoidia bacterium]